MLRILSDEERLKVREAFRQHPLYAACAKVFPRRAAHLDGVDIMEEDVFYATAQLLDELYCAEEVPSQKDIDKLWIDIYRDIRKPQLNASEDDKRQVAHTVFAIARKALCHHWETRFYETLFETLGVTIDKEMKPADVEEMDQFMSQLISETNDLQEWVNNEYDGGLSEEIEEMIRGEEGERNVNITIFDVRLKETAIVESLKEIHHNDLGEVNFAYSIHTFFETINWLSTTMDTKFVAWMKAHGLMTVKAKNLKQANPNDSRVLGLISNLQSIFQERHPMTGNWRDKKEFYLPNKKLINTGE